MSSPHPSFPPLGLRPVTGVLGPTNTGKTHYALERMCAYESGMIGLPLRLLAREVYDKMVARKGARAVALVTGEEKISPPNPSYWVCTVEAMPLERDVAFMAIDEVQLAADRERGRIFTQRILLARGMAETLLLGSDTMRPILKRLIPDIGFIERSRFSKLEHLGHKKVTRLPRRSAIVAFSSDAVYSIAELIRRQRGGAAVVMGALSPRTRNAQAALYQNGEVDYLVATDAIGMGLNMDIDHVGLAAQRKFDGKSMRALFPHEMAQVAGRAGRYTKDGTFGATADCPELDDDMVEAIETHQFDAVTALQWRSNALDFSSLPALLKSLEKKPPRQELVRARMDDDEDALRRLAKDFAIKDMAKGGAALKLLWEVCQTPDFRKVTPDQHAKLLGEIYMILLDRGRLSEGWISGRLERYQNTHGDVDALSHRISHIRTWTYLTNRSGWLDNAPYWQEQARQIEDMLSDAMHEKLTQRFVDRRTSVLLKKLKDDAPLLAGVTPEGEVIVEGEFVGRLLGFQFILDPKAKGPHEKHVRHAALKALQPELAARAAAIVHAKDDEFSLKDGGVIWWRQSAIAKLSKGPMPLRPDLKLIAIENLPVSSLPRIEDRLKTWFADRVEGALTPLLSLQKAVNMTSSASRDTALDESKDKDSNPELLGGTARGLGFRLIENFGAISRSQVFKEVKELDQTERGKLRKLGVRFGEYTLFMPNLLKPAPATMLSFLWALWTDQEPDAFEPPKAGLTSIPKNDKTPHAYYYACGYRPSGTRAVRIDMLERLAEMIRVSRQAADMREGFEATSNMMSLVGCSGEDFEGILKSLGLKKNTVKRTIVKTPVESPTAEIIKAGSATSEAMPSGVTGAVTEITPDVTAETVPLVPIAGAPEAGDTNGEAQPTPITETPVTPSSAVETTPIPLPPNEIVKVDSEEVEVTLWKSAPRHSAPPRRHTQPAHKNAKSEDGKKPFRKGKKPFDKNRKPQQKGMRTFTAGADSKKKKELDPDNPFAALAALKDKS